METHPYQCPSLPKQLRISELFTAGLWLQETTVNTMSTKQCRQTNYAPEEITETMLCASKPGTNACNGDSGGPLVVKAEYSTLIGQDQ